MNRQREVRKAFPRMIPANSIESGNTVFRVRGGRSEPQTISTKLSERETSSDLRSPNDFFSNSASASKRICEPPGAQHVTSDVRAEMRVGSIPTLDSVSKRYDTLDFNLRPQDYKLGQTLDTNSCHVGTSDRYKSRN